MSTYDSTGLDMDLYADILSDGIDRSKAVFGNSILTDDETLLGHLLRQVAYECDRNNQTIQQLYNALQIRNSTGSLLSGLVKLIGLTRQSAAKSTATVTLTVSKAVTIPAGTIVSTATGISFVTDSAVVFTGAGSDDVTCTCTEYGPYDAGAGELTVKGTVIGGWDSVTNAVAATPGRNQETDVELLTRHTTAVSTSGERDAASVYEAITAIDGVSSCLVTENPANDPPVHIYVIGGDDNEIAEAIDNQLTIGIGTAGTESVDVYNTTTKQTRTIRFSRSTNQSIYVTVIVSVNSALFPSDGDLSIKEAIADVFDGYQIGQDVDYNSLIPAIYSVQGTTLRNMYIGTTSSPTGTSNVSISNSYRAVCTTANVEVIHV